jgi:hypothetical protein
MTHGTAIVDDMARKAILRAVTGQNFALEENITTMRDGTQVKVSACYENGGITLKFMVDGLTVQRDKAAEVIDDNWRAIAFAAMAKGK